MFKKIYILLFLAPILLAFQCESDIPEYLAGENVFDIEKNLYNTIVLGNQTWMLENLRTSTFNDGTPITEHQFGMSWGDLSNQKPQYQWPDTSDLNDIVDEELPFDFYGAMYNHWAIESGKLAPEGWRIPNQADFAELENYLSNNGFGGNEAIALKSPSGWLPSSGNGHGEFNFNGSPNGYINTMGAPTLAQSICTWATTNVNNNLPIGSRTRVLVQLFDSSEILYGDNSIRIGAGVRCIKE